MAAVCRAGAACKLQALKNSGKAHVAENDHSDNKPEPQGQAKVGA